MILCYQYIWKSDLFCHKIEEMFTSQLPEMVEFLLLHNYLSVSMEELTNSYKEEDMTNDV